MEANVSEWQRLISDEIRGRIQGYPGDSRALQSLESDHSIEAGEILMLALTQSPSVAVTAAKMLEGWGNDAKDLLPQLRKLHKRAKDFDPWLGKKLGRAIRAIEKASK